MVKEEKLKTSFLRSDIDRREDSDRRQSYSIEYFDSGNEERRNTQERRSKKELRFDWVRYSKWHSVYIGDYPRIETIDGKK